MNAQPEIHTIAKVNAQPEIHTIARNQYLYDIKRAKGDQKAIAEAGEAYRKILEKA